MTKSEKSPSQTYTHEEDSAESHQIPQDESAQTGTEWHELFEIHPPTRDFEGRIGVTFRTDNVPFPVVADRHVWLEFAHHLIDKLGK